METFGFYLLRSVVWLSGFALVYFLFLRNERFFLLNRLFLLAGIVASFLMPLVTLHYTVDLPALQTAPVTITGDGPAVVLPSSEVVRHAGKMLLPALWLAGVLVVIVRNLIQIIPLLRESRRATGEVGYPVRVVRSDLLPAPLSIFSMVFLNTSLSESESREIMNHELVHVREKHWIDLMLSFLLCAVQWFNPVAWLYARFIRVNHEYLADAGALQRSSSPALYRAVLLNQIAGSPMIDLGSSLSCSYNKKRFAMMKEKMSSPYRKMRLLLVLPVASLILLAFSQPRYRVAEVVSGQEMTIEKSGTVSETGTIQLQSGMMIADAAAAAGSDAVTSAIAGSGSNTGVSAAGTARDRKITGRVTDEAGRPLDRAVILIKGTTIGVTTDAEGRFTLNNVPDDATLFISYVGYRTQEIAVASAGKSMTVMLKEDAVVLRGVRIDAGDKAANQPLYVVDGLPVVSVGDLDPADIESITLRKDSAAITLYGPEAANGVVLITTKKGKPVRAVTDDISIVEGRKLESSNDEEVYMTVEQMPEFPGGMQALFDFIQSNIKYPEEAKEKKIEGQVFIRLCVTKTGDIDLVSVVRSAHPLLDAEAVRVVKMLPKWEPGRQGSKAVNVWYVIPINFGSK